MEFLTSPTVPFRFGIVILMTGLIVFTLVKILNIPLKESFKGRYIQVVIIVCIAFGVGIITLDVFYLNSSVYY